MYDEGMDQKASVLPLIFPAVDLQLLDREYGQFIADQALSAIVHHAE